jgi:hypothetical protein
MKRQLTSLNIIEDLKAFMEGGNKTASDQGAEETSVSTPSADPEVKDITMAGQDGGGSNIATEWGTGTGEHPVESPEAEEKVRKETDPGAKVASMSFLDLIGSLRNELTEKTAAPKEEAAAKKKDEPAEDKKTLGKRSSTKEYELSDIIAGKVAQFISDRDKAYETASLAIQGLTRGIGSANEHVTTLKKAGYSDESIRTALSMRKVAEDDEGESDDDDSDEGGETAEVEDEGGSMPVESGAPEGMEDISGEENINDEEQVAAEAILELIQTGEITPEEGEQAAQAIDDMKQTGGTDQLSLSDEDKAAIMDGLKTMVEQGQLAPEQAIQAAKVIDEAEASGQLSQLAELGMQEAGGAEGGAPEGGAPEGLTEEGPVEAGKTASFEEIRGMRVGQLIQEKMQAVTQKRAALAEQQVFNHYGNSKVAYLRKLAENDNEIVEFLDKVDKSSVFERMKKASLETPSVEDVVLALDESVGSGIISPIHGAAIFDKLASWTLPP